MMCSKFDSETKVQIMSNFYNILAGISPLTHLMLPSKAAIVFGLSLHARDFTLHSYPYHFYLLMLIDDDAGDEICETGIFAGSSASLLNLLYTLFILAILLYILPLLAVR